MVVRSQTMYKMFRSSNTSNNHNSPAAPGQPRSASSSCSPELQRQSAGGNNSSGYATRSRSETPPRPPPLPREFVKRKTPPRPSPPRILSKAAAKVGRRSFTADLEEEEPVPPRPPPPISYVSTLPPPVPKKVATPRAGSKYSAKTLPMRRVSMPKQKPLQRVQPLQVNRTTLLRRTSPRAVDPDWDPHDSPFIFSPGSGPDPGQKSLRKKQKKCKEISIIEIPF